MAGVEPAHITDELEAWVERGEPLSGAARQHLQACSDCQTHLSLLLNMQEALLEVAEPVSPPPELRARLLGRAQTQAIRTRPRRLWLFPAAAAVLLLAVALVGLLPPPSLARALPDPAVVVDTNVGLLVASNDSHGTLTLLAGGRPTGSILLGGRQAPWFTEGVRLGSRVYLADAANNRVLEVQSNPLKLLRSVWVPGGVAGLNAGMGQVYYKTVRGTVGVLGGAATSPVRSAPMPLADVMDGVLLWQGQLYVTNHLTGEVWRLDPHSLALRARYRLGGAPVALAATPQGPLVLDLKGRLLRLDAQGHVTKQWPLPGTPDKLTLNADMALVSDRAGSVTAVNLDTGALKPASVAHPMDVTCLPDGTFVVAEGGRGLRLLSDQLATLARMEHGAAGP